MLLYLLYQCHVSFAHCHLYTFTVFIFIFVFVFIFLVFFILNIFIIFIVFLTCKGMCAYVCVRVRSGGKKIMVSGLAIRNNSKHGLFKVLAQPQAGNPRHWAARLRLTAERCPPSALPTPVTPSQTWWVLIAQEIAVATWPVLCSPQTLGICASGEGPW